MNIRLVIQLQGKLLLMEAALMLPALAVALGIGEGDADAFVHTIAILLAVGLPLVHFARPREKNLRAREGFVAVGLAWVLLSLFGALPFVFSGAIPHYTDAFFECVSGFTTTGATILAEIETLPRGIVYWRSFTHWIGGMGVLVLTLAVLPKMSERTSHLMRAESPGPQLSKLVPRLSDTAKILYIIYACLTVLETALLLAAGMPLYDAMIHAFGTAGTGGFSNRNLSVGAYDSAAVDAIITVFMFLFGVNFAVFYRLLLRDVRGALRNSELRAYGVLALSGILLVTLNILPLYGNFFTALRYGAFQVATVMSTTGYATANFDQWPEFSRVLMVLLMLVGACAGSTAGGMKVVRAQLLARSSLRELGHTARPRRVAVVKADGKAVPETQLAQVGVFFFVYCLLLSLGALLISLDGFDFTTNLTAAIACISNTGPGLSLVGPMGNYDMFSVPSKLLLAFLMLAGRLELFPMLILFHPAVWRKQ